MTLEWSDGYKKVSKKARSGSGRNKTRNHTGHRRQATNKAEAVDNAARRRRLNELRETDLQGMHIEEGD